MKELISACIITHRMMDKTLDSIEGLVDEAVVVCSDPKIAAMLRELQGRWSFNLRVYFRPWNNDFSAARMCSLKYARYDWILYIDSDEWVIFEKGCRPEQLRTVLGSTKSEAFLVPFINWMDEARSPRPPTQMIRIFRKDKARFEQPVQNALCGFTIADQLGGLRIEHDGYDSQEKMLKKAQDRMPIYEAEIAKEDSDDNWHIWYYYAKNCFFLKDIAKCLEACEKAIDLLTRAGLVHEGTQYVDIFRVQAICRLGLGNYYGADAALIEGALCACPRYSDAYYELYLVHGLLADHYHKCWKAELELRRQTGEIPVYDLRHWEENDAVD